MINYLVDIDPDAATGIDSIRLIYQRVGAQLDDASRYLESILIQRPPSMVLNYVRSSASIVNKGQSGLAVTVRLTNQGQARALLDTLGLQILEAGNTRDTLETSLGSLAGGESRVFSFDVDVIENPTDADDVLDLDAFYQVTDANDASNVLSDTGAVETTSWQLAERLPLVITNVSVNRDTMTWGQSGVLVTAGIRNDGDISIRLDSVRITFNGKLSDVDTIAALKQDQSAAAADLGAGQYDFSGI